MTPTRTLLLLAFANFVIGMGAFVVVGALVPIAEGFSVSPADAGWTMTIYAIVYAITSPVLVAVTGAADRRPVLLAGLAIFLAGAAAAALAPQFAGLLAARAVMALGGGLVTPIAASIAVGLMPPESRGKALATVFGGLTLAQVFGVPVGAWLGYRYGWPSAFMAVALLSAVGLALLAGAVPRGLKTPVATLGTLAKVLGDARLMSAVAFTALFMTGVYCVYTFLAPFLEHRHGLAGNGVTLVLALFGAGAVVGNAMGGFLTDRIGPLRTLAMLALVQTALMPAMVLIPLPLEATTATIVIWSVFCWSFMAPQQTRLAGLDPALTPVLFALNAAAIYIGGSAGSFLGGKAISAFGIGSNGILGACFTLAGFASLIAVQRMAGKVRPA